MPEKRLFLSPPDVGTLEREYLIAALDSGWVAPTGPALEAFEKSVQSYTQSPHAVALSSGTAAIHLALRLLGVREGDRVYCSTLTFAGSSNPILYERATPVFIDCERESWNLDPQLLRESLDRDNKQNTLPKAVILTHLYGQCANLAPILEACNAYEVPVIEDAAEALGARYQAIHAGTLGRYGIYSFNGNKILTTSGGGMFVCSNEADAQRVRKWSTQARDPAPHYQHSELGFNYRLSNLLAAIGCAQMESLDDKIAQRKTHFDAYKQAFASCPHINMMPIADWGTPNYWLSCIALNEDCPIAPDTLMNALEHENIESRPLWKPMHLQPLYSEAPCIGGSVSEDLFSRGLCLPSGSGMTEQERLRVIDIILSL